MCSVASSLQFDVGEDGTKSDSNSNSARSRSVVEASGVKANSAHDATDATLNVNDKEECNKSDTECSTPVSDSYTNEDNSIRYQHHKQLSPFPLQLMDLIENESVDENAATINGYKALEWLPTGDKFIIRDRRTVERCVLPKYFSNNCKFMSFVRKLYRWGFRQVEKNASGVMVFSHKNFIRGDPKKCRDMRSIVKRPPLSSTTSTSSPFDARKVQVGAAPNAGGIMADHLLMSNRQVFFHSINPSMMSDGRFVFKATGEGANLGYSPQPNHHYNGFESMLINPSQRLGYNRMGSAATNTIKALYASSTAETAAALQTNQDYSATLNQPNSVVCTSADQEVIMASLIMDEHPTLDAWQALQLAKRRLNGTSAGMMRLSPW